MGREILGPSALYHLSFRADLLCSSRPGRVKTREVKGVQYGLVASRQMSNLSLVGVSPIIVRFPFSVQSSGVRLLKAILGSALPAGGPCPPGPSASSGKLSSAVTKQTEATVGNGVWRRGIGAEEPVWAFPADRAGATARRLELCVWEQEAWHGEVSRS